MAHETRLTIVTATTQLEQAQACIQSWGVDPAAPATPLIIVRNGRISDVEVHYPGPVTFVDRSSFLGSVEAFRLGVDYALTTEAEVIICLHDDVQILTASWLGKIRRLFRDPFVGLAGFGGAIGVGADTIYQTPYDPMQLARIGFRSNLRDAEIHGVRSLLPEQVACLDGFSQIGSRNFFAGFHQKGMADVRPWTHLQDLGVIHHAYDGMLGCLAARYGWSTWYLPIACEHFGGRTAVGDPSYQAWANQEGGDLAFWERAHWVWYDTFRDVLPLRV